jgi:OOP family OmpA-OmpF porin
MPKGDYPNMNNKYLKVPTIALTMAISGNAFAGGYIGAGIGYADKDSCESIIALGYTACDDADTGFKFYGGYQMNRYFAVEGSYLDLGEVTASNSVTSISGDGTAFAISLKGTITYYKAFTLFGKAGVAFWDTDSSVTGFGSINRDGEDLIYGFGGEYDVNDTFGVRGEWERVDFDGEDVDLVSVSAVVKF